MLFNLWQPKAEARKARPKAPFRVEQLSPRIMLSDVSGGNPAPILPPPPDPLPAENGGGG